MTELSPGTISASVTKIFKRSRRMDTHRSSKKPIFCTQGGLNYNISRDFCDMFLKNHPTVDETPTWYCTYSKGIRRPTFAGRAQCYSTSWQKMREIRLLFIAQFPKGVFGCFLPYVVIKRGLEGSKRTWFTNILHASMLPPTPSSIRRRQTNWVSSIRMDNSILIDQLTI